MSGVGVIRTLMSLSAGLTDVIPAERIKAGVLPINTVMPAISIKKISSVPIGAIKGSDAKLHIERVQVTVHRKEEPDDRGYPGLSSALKLVVAACQSQRAIIAGVKVDSISLGTEGPDIYYEQTNTYTRSRDFVVRYSD